MEKIVPLLLLLALTSPAAAQDTPTLAEQIRQESSGGQLDYNHRLANDPHMFFLHDKVAYSKKDFAVFLWGQQVHQMGFSPLKKALALWSEIYGRPLTKPEQRALTRGFRT